MPKKKAKTAKKPKKQTAAAHRIWKKAKLPKTKSPPPAEGQLLIGGALLGTGFIQKSDPRDRDFPLGAVLSAVDDARSKEKVWQLPAHMLNQGSTNSCVGHAARISF